MLNYKILANSANAEDVVYDSLVDFIDYVGSEDKHFMVFPYNLSEYQHVEDLLLIIDNVEKLPEEVEE